jgi:two-component system OmpR family sensor kinase
LHPSERHTLFKFLLLYAGSLAFFLGIIGLGYYHHHSSLILKQQERELERLAFHATRMLRQGLAPPAGVEWALLGDAGQMIAGGFDLDSPIDCDNQRQRFVIDAGYHHLVRQLPPQAEARLLAVRMPIDQAALASLRFHILMLWIGGFGFFMTIAYFLARLILRPMRQTIQLLDRFIKDATHELTTPVSAILMSTETIDAKRLSERDQKKLDRIGVAARSLKHIYDDLAYALLAKRTPRRPEQLDLKKLIEQRVAFFEPLAKRRRICWDLKLEAYEPPRADRQALERVVDNLLSNAIKYNRNGGTIHIRLAGGVLAIRDEGGGIPADQQERIFRRFERLDKAQGGFGLGLAIARELCEQNGLTLELTDSNENGSTFSVGWVNSH